MFLVRNLPDLKCRSWITSPSLKGCPTFSAAIRCHFHGLSAPPKPNNNAQQSEMDDGTVSEEAGLVVFALLLCALLQPRASLLLHPHELLVGAAPRTMHLSLFTTSPCLIPSIARRQTARTTPQVPAQTAELPAYMQALHSIKPAAVLDKELEKPDLEVPSPLSAPDIAHYQYAAPDIACSKCAAKFEDWECYPAQPSLLLQPLPSQGLLCPHPITPGSPSAFNPTLHHTPFQVPFPPIPPSICSCLPALFPPALRLFLSHSRPHVTRHAP